MKHIDVSIAALLMKKKKIFAQTWI